MATVLVNKQIKSEFFHKKPFIQRESGNIYWYACKLKGIFSSDTKLSRTKEKLLASKIIFPLSFLILKFHCMEKLLSSPFFLKKQTGTAPPAFGKNLQNVLFYYCFALIFMMLPVPCPRVQHATLEKQGQLPLLPS